MTPVFLIVHFLYVLLEIIFTPANKLEAWEKVSCVETGNDLYNTAVRLQLILFSKDIGAF